MAIKVQVCTAPSDITIAQPFAGATPPQKTNHCAYVKIDTILTPIVAKPPTQCEKGIASGRSRYILTVLRKISNKDEKETPIL